MTFDIIPVITIPHTGTQSIIKAIDPEGSDIIERLLEQGKLTKEVFKKTEYNYVLLEALSVGWNEFEASGKKLMDHKLIDRDRKNIIFGHIICLNRAYAETLNCIKEISRNSRIIMPMRDPLLTLISNEIKVQNKIIAQATNSTVHRGGPISQLQVWMRNNLYPTSPSHLSIGGRSQRVRKYDKSFDNMSITDFLNLPTRRGKIFVPGSEYIKASNYEMQGFLFMWELWAKRIHKLEPYYIYMDLDKGREDYPDVDFSNIGKYNVSKTRPLKEAYYNKDLFSIAKELKNNLKALIDMESVLRPPLEELGYKNLLWWDTNL